MSQAFDFRLGLFEAAVGQRVDFQDARSDGEVVRVIGAAAQDTAFEFGDDAAFALALFFREGADAGEALAGFFHAGGDDVGFPVRVESADGFEHFPRLVVFFPGGGVVLVFFELFGGADGEVALEEDVVRVDAAGLEGLVFCGLGREGYEGDSGAARHAEEQAGGAVEIWNQTGGHRPPTLGPAGDDRKSETGAERRAEAVGHLGPGGGCWRSFRGGGRGCFAVFVDCRCLNCGGGGFRVLEMNVNGLKGRRLVELLDLREIPKVLLHEHLDGGLRPATVIELAREQGYAGLPTEDAVDLADWFHRGAQRGNLPEYLEGFEHTTAVMQTAEALERVAYEFIEDMHEDGVVYAEVRFAPVFHTQRGLSPDEVVAAVTRGLARGEARYGVRWGLIVCAMRHLNESLAAAELAIRCRPLGVVGFDLAGGEDGFPPKKHVEAFQAIERANFHITIHAGEAYGPESIWQALQYCGAHRLGHATRLRDDIEVEADGTMRLGSLAQYVLDRRVPLEMCLLSNLHTGACARLEDHPFGMFFRRGFRVCLNTDDRLMSDTTMSGETKLATELFDLSLADLEKLSLNAMKSAFVDFDSRIRMIFEVIKPGFAAVRERLAARLEGVG